jgi:hypothetical protein
MGAPGAPEKAIIFVGCLFSRHDIFVDALAALKENLGNLMFMSPAVPWDFTTYYNEELGTPVYRVFCFFDTIIDAFQLARIKLMTNEIETTFTGNARRQINLDPGYMTLSKVVLASTKNYAHRIYLDKGIYGEITLIYKQNRFQPLPYTYKDYQDEIFLSFFIEARRLMRDII